MEKEVLPVKTWRQFASSIRMTQSNLLKIVSGKKNLIFVAGCQRSGTTLLTKILMSAPEVANYKTDIDSELEGALILAGHLPVNETDCRECYQTTYLNESYTEYFAHKGKFRLIWVVRNPYSVVFSMCHNWVRRREIVNFPLNELFDSVAREHIRGLWRRIPTPLFSKKRKAALAYKYKTQQLFELKKYLNEDVMVVDYDELIIHKEKILPKIFKFLNLSFDPAYSEMIRSTSLSKADKLSKKKKDMIHRICWKTYEKARNIAILSKGV